MSWSLDPKQWLAPPESSNGLPVAADALDKEAMAAMTEPVGMLDEHALLRAEAAADAHVSQVNLRSADVEAVLQTYTPEEQSHAATVSGAGADATPPSGEASGVPTAVNDSGTPPRDPRDSHPGDAEAGAGEDRLEVRLQAPSAAAAAFRPRSKSIEDVAATPDALDVSLTPTMGRTVTVVSDGEETEAVQGDVSGEPVGLFIPSLTAATDAPPGYDESDTGEEEPELIHGSSISGEFSIPSPVVDDEHDEEPSPAQRDPDNELGPEGPSAFEYSAEDDQDDQDGGDVLEMDEVEEIEEEPAESAESAESAVPSATQQAPRPPPDPKRRRHWVDSVFQEHYLTTLPEDWKEQAGADVAFLDDVLGLSEGAAVLDVGCGNGRHAFAFADRGYQVTGIDNSLAMLLAAGRGNEGREFPANFLHADMREMPQDVKYDAVVCLGSTYGYFEDEANRQILNSLRELLKPNGKLVIQVFNRDYLSARLPCRSWWASKRGMVVDEAEMNYFANRLRVHRTIVLDDGRNFEHYMFMKAFTLHDLGKGLSGSGLKVLEVSGSRDTRGRFYGSESPDIWIVAERRDAEPPAA